MVAGVSVKNILNESMVVGVDVKIQKMNGGRCISKKYKK
jgi:hypothetical protein